MGTFDDRERAAEAKFALSEEQNFKVTARRNKLLGLWVAGLMGMGEEDAAAYAKTVVLSDLQEVGDEDVFRKVRADFDEAGVAQSDHQLRRKMDELLAVAVEQIQNS